MSDEGRTDEDVGDWEPVDATDVFWEMQEAEEEAQAHSGRNWARVWRAAALILTGVACLSFALGKAIPSWYSTGDVALVIVDDFSGEKSHGADVVRAAESALFGTCRIKRVQFYGRQAGSLKKALDEVLAYRRHHRDARVVINFSFGSYSSRAMARRAVEALSDSHTLMVGAAGNDDTDRPLFPAAYDRVLGVAAVTSAGIKRSYSNHGDHIALSAVPEEIVERKFEGIEFQGGMGVARYSYLIRGGTSLAAPRVAAVAASVWAIRPGLTSDEVKNILLTTCEPARGSGLGQGILSVWNAQAEVLPSKLFCEGCAKISFLAALVAAFVWGLVYGLARPRRQSPPPSSDYPEEIPPESSD